MKRSLRFVTEARIALFQRNASEKTSQRAPLSNAIHDARLPTHGSNKMAQISVQRFLCCEIEINWREFEQFRWVDRSHSPNFICRNGTFWKVGEGERGHFESVAGRRRMD
jgi:hypothetical protein